MPTTAPFPVQPELTAIALAYRNPQLIADAVLPRVPVGKAEFKYFKHDKDSMFTVPDTKVGRKSETNIVETGGTEVADFTQDYGLKDYVPVADQRNAQGSPFNPLARATEFITHLVELDREVRTASLVFAAAQYATSNKVTLSGGSQWSDYTNSNPVAAILAAMDAMLMRPNVIVLGQAVWTAVRQHPKVVESVKSTGAGANAVGMVSRQQFADLLEVQDVIVGQGWVNSAKKGASASYARAWGKHCALIYRDQVASVEGTTFGFTAEFVGKQVRSWYDQEVGAQGSDCVQLVDSVREVICANDLGYLFTNAVA